MESIVKKLFDIAEKTPDKIALTDGSKAVSYHQLRKGIIYSYKKLKYTYSLQKKDCIILSADKYIPFVYVYFAAHLLGVISVPIDPETNSIRFQTIKEKVAPKLIIGFAKYDIENSANIEIFDGESNAIEIEYPDGEDIADIIFTTGTTGKPKGVTLTHKNIVAAAQNINSFIGNTADDIELLALPISHSFGLGRLRCVLSLGATLVLLGSFANVGRFYRFMRSFNITGIGMVPASWALLKRMSGYRLGDYADQLHYIELGSAPMPIEDKEQLCRMLPHTRICMHYGLTEASRSAFLEFHSEYTHLNTVGRQTPGMTIKIFDEQGNVCPYDTDGEICVKGDAVTNGYYNEPESSELYWDGYFRTGDWGAISKDGYVTLKSRKKELINVGGKKVSPIEVEDIIRKIDGISDCACIGIPDPSGITGETIKAYVVLSDKNLKLESIQSALKGKLETYKIPSVYVTIDQIPRTSSGKIQRLNLKNM